MATQRFDASALLVIWADEDDGERRAMMEQNGLLLCDYNLIIIIYADRNWSIQYSTVQYSTVQYSTGRNARHRHRHRID